MELTPDDRRRLAGRARTLHERLETPAVDDRYPVDDVDEVLEDWRERVADGDAERFRQRLEQLSLSSDECRRRLETNAWPSDEPVPEWVVRIDALLAFAADVDRETLVDPETADSLPFAAVVELVVAFARDRIDRAAVASQIADGGRDDLEEILRRRVSSLCLQPLFIEFKTYVARRDRELALGDDPPTPDDSRRYYEAFVAALFDGRLQSFLLEYAFLSRLLARIVDQWVAVVDAFATHLEDDRAALRERFGEGDDLGRVTGIEVLGDLHADGRATMSATFESGVRAAYKPRDIGIGAAFYEFVDWVNERTDGPRLRTVEYVQRDGYGWMEWVDHEPCPDEAAVERFYRRTGALICLLYALRFYDGHYENVVAGGDHPVLVDLETLARPGKPVDRDDEGLLGLYREGTVLETNLLPESQGITRPEPSPGDGGGPENGGFGVSEVTWEGLQIPEVTNVNTDLMELSYREERVEEGNNLPRLDGEVVEADEYERAIIDGFETTYRCLREHRRELLCDDGPLSALDRQTVRFLARPTRWYGRLLESLQVPAYLRTGLAFGTRTELLARTLLGDDSTVPAVTAAVYEAERTALKRADIPRFVTDADSTELRIHGDLVDRSFFEASAETMLRSRLECLNDTDLAVQRNYLQLAFHGRIDLSSATAAVDESTTARLDDERLRRQARLIHERVADAAVDVGDGKTWLLQQGGPDGFNAQEIHYNVYSGRLGIGLFGAALYATSGDERYRQFVEDVTGPVVETVRGDGTADRTPLGVSGDGSITYGLATLGRLLDDDDLLDAATRAGRALTPSRLRSDDQYDVMQGGAGAILGLVSAYETTGDKALLERAVVAGDHLLESRTVEDGYPVWHTTSLDDALQGFSHGISGIAFALGRLTDAADDPRYAEAARESLALEHDCYVPDERNWRDLRDGIDSASDGQSGALTWCHGRPGIGLARLGLSATIGGDRLRRDVDRAIAGTDPTTLLPADHLCCGNFGRVEWLLEAGTHREDETLLEQARRLAAACIDRTGTGRFRSPFMDEHLYDPTLFTGDAGIGYSLLRLQDPSLPCVLLFE